MALRVSCLALEALLQRAETSCLKTIGTGVRTRPVTCPAPEAGGGKVCVAVHDESGARVLGKM